MAHGRNPVDTEIRERTMDANEIRTRMITALVEQHKVAAARADELGKERDVLETALNEKTEEYRAADDLRDDLERAIGELGGDLEDLVR